jgi:hypothetical protein
MMTGTVGLLRFHQSYYLKEAVSSLVLFEDERRLGPAHSSHEGIRHESGGRFSHWQGQIIFQPRITLILRAIPDATM